MEYLLLADENGNASGEEEKETCHRGNGLLHLAFLVMVFNGKDELLLARRSGGKKLWPGFWDGTVAGHFHRGESHEEAARERVFQEIGARCDEIEYLSRFRYRAGYGDVGSENEICSVFLAGNVNRNDIFLNEREVSECRFLSVRGMEKEMESDPGKFTPWFLIAFENWLEDFSRQK